MTTYYLLVFFLTIYSYALVDPNFTLFNHPFWTDFRNLMVYFGYYQRFWSALVYILFILLLFYFYFYFQKKNINLLKMAFLVGIITLFSYPFLSHDFFNYLFDAKILTFYGKNPYYFSALDFPTDSWTRFMHWTHRTYPYGPTFLPITVIPSFFSFGKFFLAFFLFKLTWFFFYFLMVHFSYKIDKKWSLILAFHPLIIIEGLVNNHNDLIALSFSVLAIYFLIKKRDKLLSAFFFVISGGIKYFSLPLILLVFNKKLINILSLFLVFILIIYLTFFSEIQPWYFLIFFAFYPFFPKLIKKLNLFFAGFLFSYYPYIFLGNWDTVEKINQKHIIISIFFALNLVYLSFFYVKENKQLFKK